MRAHFGIKAKLASVALLSLSLPASAADAPLMTVPGHLGVSPSGASTYSIPIAVPPGTAGMVPAVSLNYSSQNHDGYVGWGWSLSYGASTQGHSAAQEVRSTGHQATGGAQQGSESGSSSGAQASAMPFGSGNLGGGDSTDLRMITRCPRTLAQDSVHGGVNFDVNDRFCMEGQRLILISGTYGADGSEYRTEIETFTRVIAHGTVGTGPSWFEVHNKSGQTLEFGHTGDSQALAPGRGQIWDWALNKVTDTKGNYLTVSYNNFYLNGQIYPSRIDYTGNAAAGLATYNSVQFVYATRVDAIPYYQAGAIKQTNQILTDIKTYQGSTPVLDYKLAYRAGTALVHSRLTSVTLCDGSGGNCLPATTFTWQGGTGGVSFGSPITLSLGSGYASSIIADFNGDGIPDTIAQTWGYGCFNDWQLYTGNPNGGVTLNNPAYACPGFGNAQSVDLNGDGLSDIMLSFFSGNSFQMNTGSGLTPASGSFSGLFWAGDFNGDGRTDFYSDAADSGTSTAKLWLSNGDGTFSAGAAAPVTWGGIDVADFDGDGCTDVLSGFRYAGPQPPYYTSLVNYSCSPAVSSVVVNSSLGYIGDSENNNNGVMGDFNGDGKTDLFMSGQLYLSTGMGFTPTGYYLSLITGGLTAFQIYPGDFNGDGKTDLAIWDSVAATVTIYLSTGTSFQWGGSVSTYGLGGVLTVADLNGDGASDLALFSGGSMVFTGELLTNYAPEVITSVSTGLGATTTIKYDRLDAGTIYTKGSGATYPTQDVDNGMYVVSELDASNGLGTCSPPVMTYCYVTTYAYTGAKSDQQGRGFLGFSSVKTTDVQTGLVQTATYRTDFPYIGKMASQTTVTTYTRNGCTAGQTVNSIANTYSATSLGATRYFVSLQQSDVSGTDCEGSVLPETITAYTYDAYGNATQVSTTVKLSGVVSSTSVTNNTVSIDTTNWLFLLTNTAITNTRGSSVITRTASFGYLSGTDFLNHQTVEPGSSTLLIDTSFTLDAFGNRTGTTTTGSGFPSRSTSATYDPQGRFVLTATDALGFVDHFTNDPAFGGLLTHTDPNGLTVSWIYDTQGRATRENHPDGTYTVFSFGTVSGGPSYSVYMTSAQPYSPSAAMDGPVQAAYYDFLGRVVETQTNSFSGGIIHVSTYYNTTGEVLQKSRPFTGSAVWTTFTYDDLGRVKTATAPDSGVTGTVYHGLSVAVTDPLSHVTTIAKNPQGLTATMTDALSHNTTYSYDAFGDLVSVTDPSGNVTSNTYDIRGNRLTSTDPDMGVWHYTYDGLGELVSQTDARSQVTYLSYDLTGRMTQRVEPDLTSNWTYGTTAPSIRHLVTETTSGAAGNSGGYSRTFTYDSLSREVTAMTIWSALTYTTAYNSDGRIDTLVYPSGFTAKYVYTSLGFLSQIKDNSSGAVLYTVQGRNADMSLTQGTFGNGVVQNNTYDTNTGRLTNVRAGPSYSVANFDYIYDLLGNLTYRADGYSGVFERFCMDPLNRLTKSALAVGSDPGTACTGGTVKTIGYDAIGNITSKSDVGTYSYPAPGSSLPHAVSSITGTVNGVTNPTYAYDGNGNMTSGAGRTVTLSSFNMALSIVQGTTTTTLRYDPEHYRIDRTDTVGGVSTSMAYIGDPGSGGFAEFYNDGALHWHDYLQVDGHYVAEHFCDGFPTCTSAGTWKYFVTDNLGSVAAITDASGTVVERDSYDPWGRPRIYASGADDPACGSTPTPISKRGYTGHERIDSECLVNANARIYDPTIGRFMSPDTYVADPADLQDWNPYSYVDNRPLTLTDPTGHDGEDISQGNKSPSTAATGTFATNYQAAMAEQTTSDLSSVSFFTSDGSELGGFGGSTGGSQTDTCGASAVAAVKPYTLTVTEHGSPLSAGEALRHDNRERRATFRLDRPAGPNGGAVVQRLDRTITDSNGNVKTDHIWEIFHFSPGQRTPDSTAFRGQTEDDTFVISSGATKMVVTGSSAYFDNVPAVPPGYTREWGGLRNTVPLKVITDPGSAPTFDPAFGQPSSNVVERTPFVENRP